MEGNATFEVLRVGKFVRGQPEGFGMGMEEREFFVDIRLFRIHLIIVMMRWTGLAPWEFEFSLPGSLTCTFLGGGNLPLSSDLGTNKPVKA